MADKAPWQTVTLKPLGGGLDTRSLPSDVPPGVWRFKQNFRLRDGEKLCCREGFEKAFADAEVYVNQDLHDQGYLASPIVEREYITLLFDATLNNGDRILYAGTQSRLYWLDEDAGLWTNIANGYGGSPAIGIPQTRFKAAELQETIVFTNNVDNVLSTVVGSGSVAPVGDLLSLGVTTAAITVQFAGFTMVMNVVEDAVRQSSRIWWSDFNKPITYDPGNPGSVSNFQDLDYGDEILAAIEMAGALYIFTTAAIWRCTPTGSNTVFDFTRVYIDFESHSKCLVYPNTLVSTGTAVWYASQEAIYYYDPYQPEPIREEWLYRGGEQMFNSVTGVDPTCCQSPVAAVNAADKEVYMSWPVRDSNCINDRTLIFNYQYKSPDLYDHGFSAIANFRPANPDSAACKGVSKLFLGASTADFCIKNIGVNFSRELLTNDTAHGSVVEGEFVPFTGIYVATGYYRILRMMLPYVNYNKSKMTNHMLLEAHPSAQVTPCVVQCRFGVSFSEADPNDSDVECAVLWHALKNLTLKCLDTMRPSQYVALNRIRASGFEWFFLFGNRFNYFEYTIANADGSAAVGGDCSFSRVETDVQLQAY